MRSSAPRSTRSASLAGATLVRTLTTLVVAGGLAAAGATPGVEPLAAHAGPLAAHAASIATERGQETAAWRFLGPDGEPLPFATDDEILEFLRTAEVVESEVIEGTQNDPLRVVLERDGVRARGIFRDVDRIWRRAWIRGQFYVSLKDSYRSEVAAYRLGRLLGIDSIPPAVLREIDGEAGSLQIWLEEVETHADVIRRQETPEDPDRWARQLNTVWIFDNLVYNNDRHPGNLLVDRAGRLWMVDHTQAFQYDERLLDREDVATIGAGLWERIRAVSDAEIRAAVGEYLDDDQLEALLERRGLLVEHIRTLIENNGADAVLRRDPRGGDPSGTPDGGSRP